MGAMELLRSFNAYLDLNQAKRNASVAEPLRSGATRAALRLANAGVALAGAGSVGICVLLGLGVRRPAVYLVAVALLVAAAVVTLVTISRLAAIERDAP